MLSSVTGLYARRGRLPLLFVSAMCTLAMGWWSYSGSGAAAGALLAYVWFVRTAMGRFGGATGDLAGWFLQNCELACLAGIVLVQRWEVLL